MWEHSHAWERSASNENELSSGGNESAGDLIQRAAEMEQADPAAAFQLYREAAEAGSVWSMERIGWHYWAGTGVAADPHLAMVYFHRAICGGSWMATIPYARLLAEHGRHEDCEQTLEGGVAADFVPAYFWLAWLRYRRCKSAKVRREVRPLLEYAAGHGHPAAHLLLARWMATGKFGWRNIPRGLRLVVQGAMRLARRMS